jgi:phage tail sheath gpL-like
MSGSQSGEATLNFRYFPASTWRPSGFYAEFDPSQANTALEQQRSLIVGQILSSGTAVANAPVLAYSQTQVNLLAGVDSMLALMYAQYRLQDPYGECWILPLSDNGGGTAGTGNLSFTGPATAAGTIALYVMGVSVPVAVASADTAATIATNVTAAINAAVGVCATAAVDGTHNYQVDVTANHKGLAAGDIDLRVNYLGPQNGEVTPAGVGITITAVSGGATNPVLTTGLANLADTTFDFIAFPYTDATSMTAIEAFLNDQAGRWAAIQMLYGHAFTAYRGTVSARATFGTGRNSQHVSCLGFYNSPTPAWLESADWAGAHAIRLKVNPALGVTDMALNLLAPPVSDRDVPSSRNTLLYDGIATFTVDHASVCHIDRSITMYQTNASDQPDNSYLSTNLLFQGMYAARYLKAQLTSQFISAGKILVEDGTPIPPGAPATTPSLVFQAAVAIYAYLATQFIVQDVQSFAKNGYGAKGQKGQVLLYLPINFSDNVVQIAALIQFIQTT